MDKTNLKIEYRLLNDCDNSPWQPFTNVGELIWDGVYAIRVINDDGSWGLPFCIGDNDMVNIVVKDHVPDDNIQNSRIIVQTLTRVERLSGKVFTYNRTRRYNDSEHKWGDWVTNNNSSNAGDSTVVDTIIDINSVNPVQNKTIAEALEHARDMGRALAKRDLCIYAGALYNDTNTVIKRKAFWGEEVDHLPSCYYLNGLGDITEEQMMYIYNLKDMLYIMAAKASRWFQNCKDTRLKTLFSTIKTTRVSMSFLKEPLGAFYYSSIKVLKWTNSDTWSDAVKLDGSIEFMFNGASSLEVIDTMNFENATNIDSTLFNACYSLKECRIKNVKTSLFFSSCANLSKESVIYMIYNSINTSAITIKLHPSVYNSLIYDEEIVVALEARPLVVLVSA